MVEPGVEADVETSRVASSTSVGAPGLQQPSPPNVPVPRLRTGTLKPDAPSRRYSMATILNE